MRRIPIDPWSALAAAGALAYPFVVWFGLGSLPPTGFVLLGVLCIGFRIIALRRVGRSPIEIFAFVLAAAALSVLSTLSPTLAARFYPVAICLAVAGVFAASLIFRPTIVERLARLSEPDLPPEGVAYTTRVTCVWLGFLLLNAAISLWTAVWGTLEQWTLWNGLLSYLAMGALFAGEYLVRRTVRA